MTEQHTDKIQTKIEALLRMANDPAATEDERNLALDRVTAMVDKYQIDAARLDPDSGQYTREEIVSYGFRLPAALSLAQLRGSGLYQVVQALGAQGYAQYKSRGWERDTFVVYAAESTMEILKVLLPSLLLQEMNASAAYVKAAKAPGGQLAALVKGAADTRRAGDARALKAYTSALNKRVRLIRAGFCHSFFAAAAQRVRTTRADAVQAAGDRYSMVLVDTKSRINAAMDGLNVKSRSRGFRYDSDAWGAGAVAGAGALVGQTEFGGRGRLALNG